jgi:3-dehydroquinate synthase
LSTLDGRQLRAGLAEAIKKGIIGSPELFEFIERKHPDILTGDLLACAQLVHGASVIKCSLIAKDPYEDDLQRPLNFGHTIGHAVETVTGYGPVLHGEAVALGMACAARIAEHRGLLATVTLRRITSLLETVGLPTTLASLPVALDPDRTVAALGQIRKIRDGRLRFVLPVGLGKTVIVDDVTEEEIYGPPPCSTPSTPGSCTSGDRGGSPGSPGHGISPKPTASTRTWSDRRPGTAPPMPAGPATLACTASAPGTSPN